MTPTTSPSASPRLVSSPWSTATAGLLTREHHLTVPLDRSGNGDTWPDATPTLTVYAREVARAGTGATPSDPLAHPPLVFLQGGPGCESPRPSADAGLGWLGAVLEHYRVFLLDQRGTGRSTPIDHPGAGGDDAGTARLLTHMRADEIVEDCEDLRRALGIERWSLLGQSFGGFCTVRYLSAHADSLDRVQLTGGLPAVGRSIDEVYALTYEAMRVRSEEHYARHPGDRDRVAALVQAASRGEILDPHGQGVGPQRVRSLGSLLGASGGSDALHHLLERDPASWALRCDLVDSLAFTARNPLYAVIHESCWADGGRTAWAAERVRPAAFDADPTLLTAEHVTPQMIEDDPLLRPWAGVAQALADVEWPRLYDERALGASAAAGVSGAAAVYARDVYVPMETSLATASLIPGLRTWVTSEYEHNGSRASGGAVFRRLVALAGGTVLR
ncbi:MULTISPECIES: alpha/beta fold hydrolase [Actinomyces]|uniref:Alpha/beta fold hydrolase n=1 Tax=Actinomyces respiraculi TaxID=2744574 RepID=A0A7T0LLT9_9ACTO|nr:MULTISPECIES: alpha/beta fold hydrolase [Actinomyces]QPL06154.1 alpha/beta fold hydrolase [Actinomyces respiraculi]